MKNLSLPVRFRAWAVAKTPVLSAITLLLTLSVAALAATIAPRSLAAPALAPLRPDSKIVTRSNAQLGALTLTVTSTADSDDAAPGNGVCQTSSANGAVCTLRAAITESNARGGATIRFNIPGAGVKTITPAFPGLPAITAPVLIDGYTQPGAKQNTLLVGDDAVLNIEISGANINDFNVPGLSIRNGGDGSTIRGLVINGFFGLINVSASNNIIEGNFLGTNAAGTALVGNGGVVSISRGLAGANGNNQIGGTTNEARNVVSRIDLSSDQPNVIQGNYIGIDKTGNTSLGKFGPGIQITGTGATAGATIGGATATPGTGAGNVISGNGVGTGFGGIRIVIDGSSNLGSVTIAGNIIGLNAAGTTAVPNIGPGINNTQGSGGNNTRGPTIIGGTTPGTRNIISGNTGFGIFDSAKSTVVQGNYIGTDITGTLDRGNGSDGIRAFGQFGFEGSGPGRSIVIGGAGNARNVISGNDGDGIGINSTDSAIIQNNLIGVAANGTSALGNNEVGISVDDSAVSGAVGNLTTLISGNTIAFGLEGVSILGAVTATVSQNTIFNHKERGVIVNGDAARAVISQNAIFNSGTAAGGPSLGLGIDLVGTGGVTPNDVGDADSGANGAQNFPVIGTVSGNAISATLNSLANTSFRIEFFANDGADLSGNGEGQTYLGFVNVTTNASGNAGPFNFTAPSNLAGKFIAATATRLSGATPVETSEFSGTKPAGAVKINTTITLASSRNPSQVGQNVTFTATVNPASGTIKPTGAVTFKDGATTLGTGTLTNGVATFTTSALPVGARSISATYGGDAKFNGSSQTLTQTVNAAPTPIPTLSIADARITEGNSGTKLLAFIVTATRNGFIGPITARINTANGTATAGNDYVGVAGGTLTIAAGQNSGTVNVTINGDTTIEPDETLRVTLSAPSPANATFARASAIGTILNDDAAPALPTLSINDISVVEGNAGFSNATFTITLSRAVSTPVTVNFETRDNEAAAPGDYTAQNRVITIAAGQTSAPATVPIVGDTVVESNEIFTVLLSKPQGATLARAEGVGTIVNDDVATALPSLSINDVMQPEGNSGNKPFVFTVSLSAASAQTVTVRYATANGAAAAGLDYISNAGTLTFTPGQTTRTIPVAVVGDTLREAHESFTVNLSSPTNATLRDAMGVGGILNDDSAADLSVMQTASATSVAQRGQVVFTLTVKNNGPDAANNVTLSNVLPAGTTLLSSSPAATTASGSTLSYALGTLASGATRTISLRVQAPANAGVFTNRATVAQIGATDPVISNNTASASVSVTAGAPAFSVSVGGLIRVGPYSPSLYFPGARFVQDVTITNIGNASASAPLRLIFDGLPPSVTVAGASGTASNGKPFVNVPLSSGALGVRQSVKIRVEFRLKGRDKPNFAPRVVSGTSAP